MAVGALVTPLIGCVLIGALFAAAISRTSGEPFSKVFVYYTAFSIPVALVAYVAGDSTGISRAPAVANVVPAVLTLIAGVAVYVFGTDNTYKAVVGYCVSVFAIMFFVGLQVGAYERDSDQEAYLGQLSEMEFRIRERRKNLDLPDEMPSWITGISGGGASRPEKK